MTEKSREEIDVRDNLIGSSVEVLLGTSHGQGIHVGAGGIMIPDHFFEKNHPDANLIVEVRSWVGSEKLFSRNTDKIVRLNGVDLAYLHLREFDPRVTQVRPVELPNNLSGSVFLGSNFHSVRNTDEGIIIDFDDELWQDYFEQKLDNRYPHTSRDDILCAKFPEGTLKHGMSGSIGYTNSHELVGMLIDGSEDGSIGFLLSSRVIGEFLYQISLLK